jgi:hypothetical protein
MNDANVNIDMPPIRCRDAMLEMCLDYDGMAKLLGLQRHQIVKLCITNDFIPERLQHKAAILMSRQRNYSTRQPLQEVVIDLLNLLHRNGGRMLMKEVRQRCILQPRQIKNVEQVDRWLQMVWEPIGKAGLLACVYLTALGYQKIGAVMTDDAFKPSHYSKPMVVKGMDDHQTSILNMLNDAIARLFRLADDAVSIRTLYIAGAYTAEEVALLYLTLAQGIESFDSLKAITHEKKEPDNEN